MEESASEGSRSCSTSISSESASDTGGHGERERVGESDDGTGDTITRLKLRAELPDEASELV